MTSKKGRPAGWGSGRIIGFGLKKCTHTPVWKRAHWGSAFLSAALVCVLFGFAEPAEAARWEVRSDTSAQLYRFLDSDRRPIERLRFAEVLSISVMTPASDTEAPIFARTLLRSQLDAGVAAAFADSQSTIQPSRTDILSASVQGIGLWGGVLDFEAGRFIRLDSLGFALVDGAAVDLHSPWAFGVGVHAGVEPSEASNSFAWNPFRLDGFSEGEDEPTVGMYGLSLFSRDMGLHTLRFDAREWRDSDSNIRGRQVGGALRLAYPSFAFFDLDARLDLVDRILADLRGRVLVPVSLKVDLETRYLRLVPVFDTFSIFGIYPRYPMQELSFGGRLRMSPSVMLTARASSRIVEDARGKEVEPGAHVGARYIKGRRMLMGSFEHFSGATGNWSLALLQGVTPLYVERLVLKCGLTALKVEDSVNTGLETWGGGGHMSLDYAFGGEWVGRIYVEDHETRLEKRAVRAVLMLTTALGGSL